MKKILVPLDFTAASKNAFDELQAKIHPFFINPFPKDFFNEKEDTWRTTSLPTMNQEKNTSVTVIRETSIGKGIDYYLEQYPSQVLAMFAYQRPFIQQLFHRSATQERLAHSNIPLLVYRQ